VWATGQGAEARVHTIQMGRDAFALLVLRIKTPMSGGGMFVLDARETFIALDVRITTPGQDH
jgi:hypothetical protein